MTGCIQFRGLGEERRQGVTTPLVAQDVDEFDAGAISPATFPIVPVAVTARSKSSAVSPSRTDR